VAVPGLSLITALAPVYLSGFFKGFQYQDTYIATAGIDIAVSAVSTSLDVLQDNLTPGSFGMLVDSDFSAIVISQEVVNRIYPKLTGQEEARVTYDTAGNILVDRRNVSYSPADTIVQDLTQLTNANWSNLLDTVRAVPAGSRGLTQLNITLTGEVQSTEFYVMFDKWGRVGNWSLLVFAPVQQVENAAHVYVTTDLTKSDQEREATISLEGVKGDILTGQAFVVNKGNLDLLLTATRLPRWVQLVNTTVLLVHESKVLLKSGEVLVVEFQATTTELIVGTQGSTILLHVEDADYPDCLFQHDLVLQLDVLVFENCKGKQMPNDKGICVCTPSHFEGPYGNCISYASAIFGNLVAIIALPVLVFYLLGWRKRNRAYSSWKIEKSELILEDPLQQLGAGVFGTVYLGYYRGTQVAVKKFHKFHSRWNGIIERSDVEAAMTESTHIRAQETRNTSPENSNIMAVTKRDVTKDLCVLTSLRHPAIVTIIGAVIEKGHELMLVYEYMAQGSLFDLIHGNTVELDGELIQGFLSDITQGLQFLHNGSPQIAHGDFKSQNVLVDARFRAKVSDFGMGHWVKETTLWMAPEVIRGQSKATPASDVYSFGVVLYEIYARDLPYAKGKANIVTKEISRCPATLKSMPADIASLFKDCLREEPEERPFMNEIANRVHRFEAFELEPRGLIKRPKPGEKNFDLLLRVFPRHIAEALRDGRNVEPENHDCVTIFFSDIVSFTSLSSELTPQKVSNMLHRLFFRFDELASEYDIFKVETIGYVSK
jgi:serine/threonine protein kinase